LIKPGNHKNAKTHNSTWRTNPKWKQVQQVDNDVQEVISDLDEKLNRVLAKQEREYLGKHTVVHT